MTTEHQTPNINGICAIISDIPAFPNDGNPFNLDEYNKKIVEDNIRRYNLTLKHLTDTLQKAINDKLDSADIIGIDIVPVNELIIVERQWRDNVDRVIQGAITTFLYILRSKNYPHSTKIQVTKKGVHLDPYAEFVIHVVLTKNGIMF